MRIIKQDEFWIDLDSGMHFNISLFSKEEVQEKIKKIKDTEYYKELKEDTKLRTRNGIICILN